MLSESKSPDINRFNSGLIGLGSEKRLKVDEYIRLYLTIYGHMEDSVDSVKSKFVDVCILVNCKKRWNGINLKAYLEPYGYRMLMISKCLDGISFSEIEEPKYKFLFNTVRQLYIVYGSDYIIPMSNKEE